MAEAICEICLRRPTVGYNKPHSLHRTKRIIRPNLQKINGSLVCTRCQRTLTHTGIVVHRRTRSAKKTVAAA